MLLPGTYCELLTLSLSKADRPFVKSLLFLSEKMARCIQQSTYLKFLKIQARFPKTIENLNLPSFFNNAKMKNSATSIKTIVLNKTIRYINSQAAISRNRLSTEIVNLFGKFGEQKAITICSTIERAYQRSKALHEQRLLKKKKFAEQRNPTETMTPRRCNEALVTDLTGTLDNEELDLLAKGPKFAITAKVNELEIRASFSQLAYQLRWQAENARKDHANERRPLQTLFKYPQGNFICQPRCQDQELEAKLRTCYAKIMQITQQLSKQNVASNISCSERRTLKRLQEKDFCYLPSDKGSEFCVVENTKYDDAAFKHLGNTSTYKPVQRMTPKTVEDKINQTWKSVCIESNIDHSTMRSYVSNNTNLPRFYHLIKTHKSGPQLQVRPIVSNKGGPSYKLSWLLSRLLKPLLDRMPAHLENSYQLIQAIETIPTGTLKKFSYPFSLDVVSLYTSIPPQDSIKVIEEQLQGNSEIALPFTAKQVVSLLTCILNNTYFEYKGKIFQQISGLPMGNSVSGILAMAYMSKIEGQIVNSLNIGLYKRYVDDILILTTNREEAEAIFNVMNNCDPNIKFELEHPDSANSISLLDFCVTIEKDGTSKFRFYKKAAKINTFPHFYSAMPFEIKQNALQNEMERISTRCSAAEDKEEDLANFLNDLASRGYSKVTTKKRRNRASPTSRPKNWCYFEFPFVNDATHYAIRNVFKAAQLPVRIFCKNRNLRSLLNSKKTEEKCTIRNCYLQDPTLCNSKMCVYEMTCRKCSHMYIGSTTRRLHTRVREHFQRSTSSVYRHCGQCSSEFDVRIIARDQNPNRLRFKEAVHIQRRNPELNTKFEREELLHLIF